MGIMSVLTYLENMPLSYAIPIICGLIFCILQSLWLLTLLYDYYISRPKINIIYDKSKNGLLDVLEEYKYKEHYICRIVVKNITKKTLKKVQVFIEDTENAKNWRGVFFSYDNQKTRICDISPRSSQIVTIAYLRNIENPPKDRKILVKCNAENMIEITKEIIL